MKTTAVSERDRVLKEVRAALEREPRINLHKSPVEMEFSEGVLTLEGEVEHIAAKKLGLARIIHDSAKKKSHRGSTLCYRSGDQATSTGSDGGPRWRQTVYRK